MKTEEQTEIIYKRYNRYSKFYNFSELPMEFFIRKWRRVITNYGFGKVLEVGVGTGKNIPFYQSNINLTVIDFSSGMLHKAIKKFGSLNNINFIQADIQKTEFETDEFDTVIASFVFCSVPDPVKGLKEVRRICKKEGRIILLEHVRSKNKILGALMDWLNPFTVKLFGFNINRNTSAILNRAGFRYYKEKYLWLDILKLFIINNNSLEE